MQINLRNTFDQVIFNVGQIWRIYEYLITQMVGIFVGMNDNVCHKPWSLFHKLRIWMIHMYKETISLVPWHYTNKPLSSSTKWGYKHFASSSLWLQA
jgi:hypothetical protein